jgi:hypothetical protein
MPDLQHKIKNLFIYHIFENTVRITIQRQNNGETLGSYKLNPGLDKWYL